MTRRGLLLFVAMCLIWGIPYLFIRVAVGELAPATLVFFRTAVAAVILLPIALRRGGTPALLGKWQVLVAFAAVEIGIPWFCLASAEQQISSSLAGLLISAVPLAAMLIAPALGSRDRMGPANIAGLVIGLAGVVAIVGFDLRATGWLALAEIAVVILGYALGPVILSRYLASLPAVSVTAYSLALCAVAYAPLAALQWPRSVPSPEVLASVAVLSIICTALAFLLFFALVAEIGPVRATVITYVNPAVAAVVGVLVLHESFTIGMGVGFLLVL
ncbi:MAG TPA: DMT family transporter, partial [Candidatus Dormibacteraeota bacterium]